MIHRSLTSFLSVSIVMLSVLFFLEFTSSLAESQTVDEGVHLASGYSGLVTKDFRMNPEHPPLLKLWSAWPLLFLSPHLPLEDSSWGIHDQWEFAERFLYHNTVDPELLLLVGRVPTMIVSLVLGILLVRWSKELWGKTTAFITLLLFVFEPNLLAHSRYITTDLGVTFFFALTLYTLHRYLLSFSKRDFLFFAIAFGGSQLSKFSALFLFPLLILFLFLKRFHSTPSLSIKRILGILGGVLLVVLAMIGIVYDFETFPYWEGLIKFLSHVLEGHPAYLFGRYSNTGWWYYFPSTLLIKSTLPMIILFFLGLGYFGFRIRRLWKESKPSRPLNLLPPRSLFRETIRFFLSLKERVFLIVRRLPFPLLILIMTPVFYFLFSLPSRINIGHRHLLPIYPFLILLVSRVVVIVFRSRRVLAKGFVVFLILFHIFSTLRIAPFFLSYANEAFGGPQNLPRFLLDSNVDWGQDFLRLQQWMAREHIPEIALAYFGSLDVGYYGMHPRRIPQDHEFRAIQEFRGVAVISAHILFNQDFPYSWLRNKKPDHRIGYSLYVYDRRY